MSADALVDRDEFWRHVWALMDDLQQIYPDAREADLKGIAMLSLDSRPQSVPVDMPGYGYVEWMQDVRAATIFAKRYPWLPTLARRHGWSGVIR